MSKSEDAGRIIVMAFHSCLISLKPFFFCGRYTSPSDRMCKECYFLARCENYWAKVTKLNNRSAVRTKEYYQGLLYNETFPPFNAPTFVRRSYIFIDQGNYQEAISDTKDGMHKKISISNLFPPSFPHYFTTNFYNVHFPRLIFPLFFLISAIKLDDCMFEAHFFRGLAHLLLGQFEEAVTHFSSCHLLNPQCVSAYLFKAKAQLFSNPPAAVATLFVCNNLHTEVADVFFLEGLVALFSSKQEEAMQKFSMCIEKSPRASPLPFYFRGIIFEAQKKYDEALEDLENCLERGAKSLVMPSSPRKSTSIFTFMENETLGARVLLALSRISLHTQQYERVVNHCNEGLLISEKDAVFLCLRCIAEKELGSDYVGTLRELIKMDKGAYSFAKNYFRGKYVSKGKTETLFAFAELELLQKKPTKMRAKKETSVFRSTVTLPRPELLSSLIEQQAEEKKKEATSVEEKSQSTFLTESTETTVFNLEGDSSVVMEEK